MACPRCAADLPEGARFCPACGAPVEQRPATDERKLATVLFADLVGSTTFGEQDPERTRATLERFYDAMEAEVELAGGTIEKFAGDAVMAAFGAPAAQEDHVERALHAALAMQRRMTELFGGELSLRIGVNTGEVVVGRAREGSSFVTGDAVNVAARLEQAAAAGEVVVGERSVAAARGAFEFGEPVTVEAKGKPGGVACCRLVRSLSLMRPRGVRGLERAFVGRDAELELLRLNFRRAVERGETHFVTLMGESGVGKTTIVRELWQWLGDQSPPPLRRTGRCLPYGQGITYWPLAEILKEHLGLLDSDAPEEVQRRLAPREILGLTLGLDVGGDLHPLAARDRLHDAWVELLEELAAERPTVVLVEDLHWAEEPLLDLLERLLRDVHGPLLIIGTARPELLDRRPAWGGGRRNVSLVGLEPLSAEDSLQMVDALLASPLPQLLRETIAAAEGNPFFVEEIVATLLDRGVLERRAGGWSVDELSAGFEVPDSVHAVLAARMDLLPSLEKAALQAGAVVGRIFWDGPVRELVGEEPDFGLLEERDFIRRRSGSSMAGQREYAIKHALTREVAYASLPKARRARMHAAFADWLESESEARDDLAPLLGHHYAEAIRAEDRDLAWSEAPAELARLCSRAAHWLRRAAELARGRYAMEEAVALFQRALESTDDPGERSHLWRELGLAHALRYDGEAFWTAMQRSLETCHSRAVCADTYSQLAFQTSIRSGMWPRRPEPELVDGWVEQALALAEPATPAYARALMAGAVSHVHERSVDEEKVQEAAAMAEHLGDPDLRSWGWATRAAGATRAGRFDEAFEWTQRRFELEEEISDPDHLVEMRESAIPTAAALGRLQEARQFAREHLERTQTLSSHHKLHSVALHAEVEEVAGDWKALRALEPRLEQAVAENAATPCIRHQRSLLLAAAARAHLGDRERALELARAADAMPQEGHSHVLDPVRVHLALGLGDLETAAALLAGPEWPFLIVFGLAPALARLDGLAAVGDRDALERVASPLARQGLVTEPYALRALGVVREDPELVRRAADGFDARGMKFQAARTRALL